MRAGPAVDPFRPVPARCRRGHAVLVGKRGKALVVALAACALLLPAALTARRPGRPTWRLVEAESFDAPLHVDDAPWVRDPQGDASPWDVDAFDDDGEAWRVMSGPAFSAALRTFDVYRKRVRFGRSGW